MDKVVLYVGIEERSRTYFNFGSSHQPRGTNAFQFNRTLVYAAFLVINSPGTEGVHNVGSDEKLSVNTALIAKGFEPLRLVFSFTSLLPMAFFACSGTSFNYFSYKVN